MPKVSVVIAAYNHARFVRQCIESVLGQSFQDFEVVVTDDGSRDGTPEVIRSFADPRIKLEVFAENKGACVAMNSAIERARGTYVAVLNSDDYFLPGKLEQQVFELDRQPALSALFGRALIVDERGMPLPGHPLTSVFATKYASRHDWLRHFFFKGNALCHPTLMIRRECYGVLGGYDIRLFQLPDLDMWIRLCSRYEIDVLDVPVTGFRILDHEANVSGGRPEVHARTIWEHGRIVRRFRALSAEDFAAVFAPEYTAMKLSGQNQDVALGRLALTTSIVSQQAFGLDLLFDSLEQKAQGITARELSELAKQVDPFGIKRASAKAAKVRPLSLSAMRGATRHMRRAVKTWFDGPPSG